MPFFILFFIVPLIEISLFVAVGDEIGILATLLLCVLTAALGALVLREQGYRTWAEAQVSLRQGKLPVSELYTGFCLVIAGALLMTPGFFTDTVGFALLIPAVREWILAQIKPHLEKRGRVYRQDGRPKPEERYTVIDVEYEEVDNDNVPSDDDSAKS